MALHPLSLPRYSHSHSFSLYRYPPPPLYFGCRAVSIGASLSAPFECLTSLPFTLPPPKAKKRRTVSHASHVFSSFFFLWWTLHLHIFLLHFTSRASCVAVPHTHSRAPARCEPFVRCEVALSRNKWKALPFVTFRFVLLFTGRDLEMDNISRFP
ncbi:hypothetical protein BC828DRAFT_253103 [Blastocladiella britannica]|nr:hypothetical protein BC828DRAFT_253103 [Blastocladiella britannica]